MKKDYRKLARHLVTFEHGDDNTCLMLAKLGMSTRCIMARTDLSESQVTYRLTKAKQLEERLGGYRVEFRNGISPIAQRVIRDLASIARAEIERNVVPKIIVPTPKVVRHE